MAENASPSSDADTAPQFQDAVRQAAASSSTLFLCGGGSKQQLLGRDCTAQPLDLRAHRGVVDYRPEELVLTARSGTPIAELRKLLAAGGQCLPFEPGEFDGRATIGGCLASGLSGPARPWRGSIRDCVLGTRLINGRGEHLRFGGQVIKNVAGYDVSRLQAGALGTLGLITEVSLKLAPQPQASITYQRHAEWPEALVQMRRLCRRPWPITGLCWFAGKLYLRLEGQAAALEGTAAELEDFADCQEPPWAALREWSLAELLMPEPRLDELCLVDLAPAARVDALGTPLLVEWAGARRVYAIPRSMGIEELQQRAAQAGGHAMRLGCGESDHDVIPRPAAPLLRLQQRVKQALDPDGVFNPGRLLAGL